MTNPAPDWAALYEKHRDAMYGAALSVLGRKAPDLANDAVNDAIVSLMEKPPSDVQNWRALLALTAKRRALDIVRSSAVKLKSEIEDDYVDDRMPSGDAVLRRLDVVARVRAATAKLNTQEQFVLDQYLVQQRDRREVADALGVTPGRVSQIATKVRLDLRAALEEGG